MLWYNSNRVDFLERQAGKRIERKKEEGEKEDGLSVNSCALWGRKEPKKKYMEEPSKLKENKTKGSRAEFTFASIIPSCFLILPLLLWRKTRGGREAKKRHTPTSSTRSITPDLSALGSRGGWHTPPKKDWLSSWLKKCLPFGLCAGWLVSRAYLFGHVLCCLCLIRSCTVVTWISNWQLFFSIRVLISTSKEHQNQAPCLQIFINTTITLTSTEHWPTSKITHTYIYHITLHSSALKDIHTHTHTPWQQLQACPSAGSITTSTSSPIR